MKYYSQIFKIWLIFQICPVLRILERRLRDDRSVLVRERRRRGKRKQQKMAKESDWSDSFTGRGLDNVTEKWNRAKPRPIHLSDVTAFRSLHPSSSFSLLFSSSLQPSSTFFLQPSFFLLQSSFFSSIFFLSFNFFFFFPFFLGCVEKLTSPFTQRLPPWEALKRKTCHHQTRT